MSTSAAPVAAGRVTTAPAGTAGERVKQPKAVWATAFAAVVAFMGIGLVDPILPAIAKNLDAGPSQVSLLFTSYFLVTAFAMLITGALSSRIGGKRTLLVGLALVVVFASLSGTSNTVAQLVGFRAGWGLGNALFVATALAVIVGVASGGTGKAIILYEAALGIGISTGPLLGAALGGWQWRAPFFGTATLMAIGFVAVAALLPATPKPATRTSPMAPLRALTHPGLRTTAVSAIFYNYGFFTILAFTPFVLGMSAYGIGAVFFGWGLALAISSVFVAPRLQARFGVPSVIVATLLTLAVVVAVMAGAAEGSRPLLIVAVVASGALLGINNTLYTELAMEVSDAPRPVASAGYNFVRWFGGAVAPYIAGKLGEDISPRLPYVVAALALLIGAGFVLSQRRHLQPRSAQEAANATPQTPRDVSVASANALEARDCDENAAADREDEGGPLYPRILVPMDDSPHGNDLVTTAGRIAVRTGARVRVVHVQPLEASEGEAVALEPADLAATIVADAIRTLRSLGVDADGRTRSSSRHAVGSAVLDEMHEFDARLVVLGGHRHDRFAGLLLDDVTAEVARRSQCPVLLVP